MATLSIRNAVLLTESLKYGSSTDININLQDAVPAIENGLSFIANASGKNVRVVIWADRISLTNESGSDINAGALVNGAFTYITK